MKTTDAEEIDFRHEQGIIEGSAKDLRSITSDWTPVLELIDGVKLREVKNVLKDNGFLTEVFRADWSLDAGGVDQVFQVVLAPGGLSAWHAHQFATDRLFVSHGLVKVVLFDARTRSPTHGRLNEFRVGLLRPTLIVIPPGVWHGVQNISPESSCLLNMPDRAYTYDDPDHWRLPPDTPEIPYSFAGPPTR
ncbi:MAG TPA: dTDP-4-dehydrorhamnose 3,5-epimerase family protein [Pyrinomonadaceae bacterium]